MGGGNTVSNLGAPSNVMDPYDYMNNHNHHDSDDYDSVPSDHMMSPPLEPLDESSNAQYPLNYEGRGEPLSIASIQDEPYRISQSNENSMQ